MADAKPDAVGNGKSPLIVTRGDGVPMPDQAAALDEFKRQCLQSVKPPTRTWGPYHSLVEGDGNLTNQGGTPVVVANPGPHFLANAAKSGRTAIKVMLVEIHE